jgi:hypothetical protein
MIDNKKIEDAIDNYFQNTPTAKIIENLDRHSLDRKEDLDRENINHPPVNNKESIIGKLVRFEEVSPANQDAAFIAVSIEQLVAHLGLPIYEGYDDLDEMRLTFLTLPSGQTVTVGEYLNCPQPGTSIYVDTAMQNIPQIVFDSCLQLQVSREEVIWFHPDWQVEIDQLYADNGDIEKRPELSQLEEIQRQQYEPIDCFNHALKIYPREYVPATYWAMLQHNLGLAYFNRNQGDRRENLERSIECFNKSLEVFTQYEFPEKWGINQEDLVKSQRSIKQMLVKDILDRPIPNRNLKDVDLSAANLNDANLSLADLSAANLNDANLSRSDLSRAYLSRANLSYADLRYAKLSLTNLNYANLSRANLSYANLSYAYLSHANLSYARLNDANLRDARLINANLSRADLSRANLSGVDLSNTDVNKTRFGYNLGISESMKQDLIERGAIFDNFSGDRSESRNLVPR